MNPPPSTWPGIVRSVLVAGATFAAGAAGGYLASRHLPHALLAPLLKYAIGVIGVVWLFSLTVHNKLSDVTEMSGLDFRQHRHIETEIRQRLRWFWLRAIGLGGLAVCLYVPTLLAEAQLPVSDGVLGLAFGALVLALFSLRRLWAELEEIRELKSYVKEIERREKARADVVDTLKDGLPGEWRPDPTLDGFRSGAGNTPP
jgi:hypothetical protein